MATWDSADLLSQFKEMARWPATSEITDAQFYARLARAQQTVLGEVAARYPQCLYQAPTTLTSSDGGYTYTFGTDANGHAVAPLGMVGIYADLSDVPDNPLEPGADYLDEGTRIRIPNDMTDPGPLYWYGIPTPADIAAGTEPSLRPAPARILIVIRAVWDFAREGAWRPDLAAEMEQRWRAEFPVWMQTFRTRFRDGGALVVTLSGNT